PLDMLASNIAFAITDVDDDDTRVKERTIGTANPTQSDALGTVLIPSPEIEQILQGLEYANARVWVVDKHKRVLARAGDIQNASGLNVAESYEQTPSLWTYIESQWLFPLYYMVLNEPPKVFIDELADAYELAGQDIEMALSGESDTLWRLSSDKQAVILSAAHPIFVAGEVMGAVVVEQTTNGIRTLRNKALEQQFHFFLSVLVIGTFSLFLFATRISSRIRRLRNDTELAIDPQGKIIGMIPTQNASDEIGDLGRSFAQVLERLAQYNHYLENMAARLSHELRTPVAIVNSSLENLALNNAAQHNPQNDVFIQRAQDGIKRLSLILQNMSEATRLEHTLKSNERESFDVIALCDNMIGNSQMTATQHTFNFDNTLAPGSQISLNGAPELFA
ncbi:MAG TPA: proteobacterial dedicated sortase system histidine kinase, partial [Glaciecola sp.]|nr:proteobacterial dedicated sortase system histidine kinase [Glaciecola sp.]